MAVEVYKLHQALTRFDFGETAAMPFMQQSGDQRSLDQDYDRNQRQLPTLFFPGAELTKQDFASWRQIALADAPALHLPPIVFRRRKSYRLHLDIARLLATEDMRIAASAVFPLDSSIECIGPPTVFPPKNASWKE
jgi:hypothetical protein